MKPRKWVLILAAAVPALLAQSKGNPGHYEAILEAKHLMAEEQCLEAEKVLLNALRVAEKVGPDTADMGAIANNLACVYIRLGRYREAEHFARQSLFITERLSGENDPVLALDLNTLGGAYYRQGLYSKAEPLFRRALEITVRTLGPDHPETLRVQANLAYLYTMRLQFQEAERLHRGVLKGLEKTFGPESPEVALELSQFAILRFRQGATAEATSMLEGATRILGTVSETSSFVFGLAPILFT